MTIRGEVSSHLQPLVTLRLQNAHGEERSVSALLDTGCTLSLVLSESHVEDLALEYLYARDVTMADGAIRSVSVYQAWVAWEGQNRPLRAAVTGEQAILGMQTLIGYGVRIEVVDGGRVEVAAL